MRVAVCYRDEDRAAGRRLEEYIAGRLGDRVVVPCEDGPLDGLVVVIGPGRHAPVAGADVDRALQQAFAARAPVVPFLVGGASLPSGGDLPPEIAGIADLTPVRASDEYWSTSADAVVRRLALHRAHRTTRLAALVRRRPALSAVAAVIGIVTSVVGMLAALGMFDGDDPEAGTIEVAPTPTSGLTLHEFLSDSEGGVRPGLPVPADTEGYAFNVTVTLERAEDNRYTLRWTLRDQGQNRVIPPYQDVAGEHFPADEAAGVHRLWIPCPKQDALPFVVALALVNDTKPRRPLDEASSKAVGSCRVVED